MVVLTAPALRPTEASILIQVRLYNGDD